MAMMFLSRKRNKRSNVPLSFTKAVDLSVGTITPVAMVPVVTDDVFHFQPSSFVQAMAMKAPLVNGYRLCLEYFFAPDRLYHGKLLLNETGVTEAPDTVVFPSVPIMAPAKGSIFKGGAIGNPAETTLEFPDFLNGSSVSRASAAVDFSAFTKRLVQPNSFADMLGIPVGYFESDYNTVGETSVPSGSSSSSDRHYVDVTSYAAYLDIFLNYYANTSYSRFLTSEYRPTSETASIQESRSIFDLQRVINGLKRAENPSSFIAQNAWARLFFSWENLCSRNSLFQRSLPPYYLEQWIQTAYGEDIENTVKVDVSSNSVRFSNIRRASHLQRFLELSMAGGTRYSDYLNAQFDTSRVPNSSVPIYLGSDRQFLGSRVIYQTTGFDDSQSPLGAFAGQASGGDRFKKRTFKFGENGTFFVMATLVPDTIYYRGMDPAVQRIRLDDRYTPALDNIGFEPLSVRSVDALPPVTQSLVSSAAKTFGLNVGANVSGEEFDLDRALGFVPAWSSYTQALSRVHGALQGSLKYWVLAREYGSSPFKQDFQESVDAYIRAILQQQADTSTPLRISDGQIEAFRTLFDNLAGSDVEYTPYIQNHLYNSVFADTSWSARNFVLTFSADLTVNREKSKVNIPNTI